jgi:hypothetical protein
VVRDGSAVEVNPRPVVGALGVFSVAVVFHLGVVLLVHGGGGDQPLFPDARGYEAVSLTIADLWRGGRWLSLSDLASLTGSELWGYPVLMALCRVLTGGGWLAAKLLLAVLSAMAAPAAYGLAVVSGRGHRRGTVAGLAVGASPSLLLWDSWGLKDGLLVSLVLCVLFVQTRVRFSFACVVALIGTQTCLYLRPAAGLFLLVALLARVRFRRGYLLGLGILLVGATTFFLARSTVLFHLIETLQVKDGTALGFTGGYGSTNLLSHPEYFGTFLFGPFPWAFGPETAVPERLLYPGTMVWIMSLALVPSALRGAWADARGIGRSVILGSMTYAAMYLLTFGGAFYRQRSLLECAVVLLVVLYIPLSLHEAAVRVFIWLGAVAGFATLQSDDLAPTPQTKAILLVVMCLGVTLSIVANSLAGITRLTRRHRPVGTGRPYRRWRRDGGRSREFRL